MSSILVQDIINNLVKLENIMSELDKEKMSNDIKSIDKMIKSLSKYSNVSIKEIEKALTANMHSEDIKENKKKGSFKDNLKLLEEKRFMDIQGIKLNYENFKNNIDVVNYFDKYKKEDILKTTTVLDLKLLYCILTGRSEEIKGKKESIYEDIKNNIKAKKRGEAFKRF